MSDRVPQRLEKSKFRYLEESKFSSLSPETFFILVRFVNIFLSTPKAKVDLLFRDIRLLCDESALMIDFCFFGLIEALIDNLA